MLTVRILGDEFWDESLEQFVYPESTELQLEHSLVSLSKWEAEFQKPFLDGKERTDEEAFGYIKAMLLTPDPPPEFLQILTEANVKAIDEYINKPMTATWFGNMGSQSRSSEIITNELIYYMMSQFNIPAECENWHLNRLFTLIRVHAAKSEPPKKMNKESNAAEFRRLNEQRRAERNSKG